jgi:hypothetical protein
MLEQAASREPPSSPVRTLAEVKKEVDRRAAIIGAEGAHALPTYGRSEDFARPHIELDSCGYHFVVVERGQELERFTSRDLDEILFQVFETVTFSLASEYELAHRVQGQDFRRLLFQRQVELLSRISELWGQREAARHEGILREHPFRDRSD